MNTPYVAGFLFNAIEEVALIRKTRPDWQKGKLNGIGGHIEPGESPLAAMQREFQEETGAVVHTWQHFCTLIDPYEDGGAVVYFFTARGQHILKSMTDEPIVWMAHTDLHFYNLSVIPNLHWLIPMALMGSVGLRGEVWPYNVKEHGVPT